MKFRLIALFVVLAFAVIVAPVMADAVPGDGNTCTSNPDDSSGLPECGSPDDNECNPGGVLYREENQDGCKSEWYWKAGWFLARFNDGKFSREDFPQEFASVLPPKTERKVGTVCKQALAINTGYYGCFSSDQTGYDLYNGDFYEYDVFVSDSKDCPTSFNGLPLDDYDDTSSYVYDYYLFTADELATLGGGLLPVTCYYN